MFDQRSDPIRPVGRFEVLLGENVRQLGIVVIDEGIVAGLLDNHPFLGRLADGIPARLAAEAVIDCVFIGPQIEQIAHRRLHLVAQARHILRHKVAVREFEVQTAESPEGEILELASAAARLDTPSLRRMPMKSVVQPMNGEPRILMPNFRSVSPAK